MSATATPQPVEAKFTGAPLYDLPYDYRQTVRAFTVAVAGPGRHIGELPHLFVVESYSTESAWAKVLSWYMVEHETVDALVVAAESFEGTPPKVGPYWHDLRPECARQETLDDLADQAAEMVAGFNEGARDLADQPAEHERAIGDAAFSAWPLVLQLAENDGRD
ncbi:hypothetical protein [Streptomyces sp. NBC_01727]|uniref:hypothetical protein n=1 Tax=Streptomyces sp. NBC_01727 TaxID=2975924 RepID=UPI002E108A1A|nr:hypothetical protein OIE76_07410 [Streptomyces sp. NBC_01727]